MSNVEPYFIMSMGITFVLMVGSIDLSIGTMCSAAACLVAVFLPQIGIFAFALPLLLGIIGGAINGFLVSKLKLVSFIATLGTMCVWSSLAYLVTGTKAVTFERSLWVYTSFDNIYFGIIPVTFIVALIIWTILLVVQHSTPFGKRVFATGVNERAAQIAGVNVVKVKMVAFIISGLFSALAGVALVSKLKGAEPTAGDSMTMLPLPRSCLAARRWREGEAACCPRSSERPSW